MDAGEGEPFRAVEITPAFLDNPIGSDFTAADRRRIVRALRLLVTNERHPSLRVHQLHGAMEGVWSASASDELRITFERLSGGRKLILSCSRHYQR